MQPLKENKPSVRILSRIAANSRVIAIVIAIVILIAIVIVIVIVIVMGMKMTSQSAPSLCSNTGSDGDLGDARDVPDDVLPCHATRSSSSGGGGGGGGGGVGCMQYHMQSCSHLDSSTEVEVSATRKDAAIVSWVIWTHEVADAAHADHAVCRCCA